MDCGKCGNQAEALGFTWQAGVLSWAWGDESGIEQTGRGIANGRSGTASRSKEDNQEATVLDSPEERNLCC